MITEKKRNENYVKNILKNLFSINPLTSFIFFGWHVAPYISSAFLIKSGMDDIKKIQKIKQKQTVVNTI